MRNLRTKIKLSAVLLIGIFLLFLTVISVQAATSTVRGSAYWGENYEYVYFNCLDDLIGDRLDVSENLYALPEPRGFHFYSSPCADLSHAVYLNGEDNFSGQAWNPTKGLISFDANQTPPDGYGFNSKCPNTCNLSNNCWACYLEEDQKIYGWARVVSDNTWIKFSNATATPAMIQSWDLSQPVLPGHDIDPGYFSGYATSTLGDMSLNCESEGGGAGTCATRDYAVYISNLQIGHLSAPNWNYTQACSGSALSAVLRWYKKSGQQTAYEIVINDSDTLSTSSAVCWSGKKTSAIASQYILPNSDPDCASLSYNTNYYWWIRLYDEDDSPTEWYKYSTNSVTDSDGDPDTNPETFTTFKHEFPNPFFIYEPTTVLVGTTTLFTSNSQFYSSASPGTPQSCASSTCSYLWDTTDTSAIISNATSSTSSIIFFFATTTTVTLQVTDVDSYVCSTSTQISINYDLPLWREVKAE